jgi:hypothetical protein
MQKSQQSSLIEPAGEGGGYMTLVILSDHDRQVLDPIRPSPIKGPKTMIRKVALFSRDNFYLFFLFISSLQ